MIEVASINGSPSTVMLGPSGAELENYDKRKVRGLVRISRSRQKSEMTPPMMMLMIIPTTRPTSAPISMAVMSFLVTK